MAEQAANSLQLGPPKAKELQVIDDIIKEPPGGAHKDPPMAFKLVKEHLSKSLQSLTGVDIETLLQGRFEKFRKMGNKTIASSGGKNAGKDSRNPNSSSDSDQ